MHIHAHVNVPEDLQTSQNNVQRWLGRCDRNNLVVFEAAEATVVPLETHIMHCIWFSYQHILSGLLFPVRSLKIATISCKLSTWKSPKEQVWRWNDMCSLKARPLVSVPKLISNHFTEVSRQVSSIYPQRPWFVFGLCQTFNCFVGLAIYVSGLSCADQSQLFYAGLFQWV